MVTRLTVNLNWITLEADTKIAYLARVSNPNAKEDDPSAKLIKYLIKHNHWSPFEMACACVEIVTTRDIARQILRHRSFHFQEFSQRYAEVWERPEISSLRLQDKKNRQNSIQNSDSHEGDRWFEAQYSVWDHAYSTYKAALGRGVAKELARKLLPEGLTPTKMYMQGTVRDWLHYIAIRTGPETQYEHRQVANAIASSLKQHLPITFAAATEAGVIAAVGDA